MESPERSVTIEALTDLDPEKASLAQAKESHRCLSNTWCCKRMRRMDQRVHLCKNLRFE
jgi:hypothetical protein